MQFYILGGQTLKLQLEKKKKKPLKQRDLLLLLLLLLLLFVFVVFFFFEILFGVVMSPYRNTLITEKGKSI